MRKILLAFAAFTALFAPTTLAVQKEDGVLVLTEANFDEELSKHEYLLVEFYAPWCGHCKKLTPEYAAAAAILGKQNPPRYLAKVDATENNALAERFEVKGFPTLFWFVNGQKQDYAGGRTSDTIVSWVTKKTGPASVETSCDSLDSKLTVKLNLVYFGDFSGAHYDTYLTVAKGNENYQFFHTSGDCAASKGGQSNSVSIFRSFDSSPVHYSGEFTFGALSQWLETSSIPQVIVFSEDYIEPIFGKGRSALILFTNNKDAAYNKVFTEAASELKGSILFVVSGTEEGIQQRLAEFVGVDSSAAPTIRLLSPGEEMRKFVYGGALDTLTVESLKNYIDEFKSGNLRPHLKSEAEPTTQGPVTVIVGTTWESIVLDKSKDVLVKYYAPWCGHCKSLAPVWEELGAAFADNDDVVIAKFDATANEVAGLSIRGYPTLKFYSKDNKNGVDYEGDRDLESFKSYLKEHSSAARSSGKAAQDEL